jgi:hypothetical protein
VSAPGSTTLPPDCWARGYRDGFSGHAPRRDANGSDDYRRCYKTGVHESGDVRWMAAVGVVAQPGTGPAPAGSKITVVRGHPWAAGRPRGLTGVRCTPLPKTEMLSPIRLPVPGAVRAPPTGRSRPQLSNCTLMTGLHECSQCSVEGDACAVGVREFQSRTRNRHNR